MIDTIHLRINNFSKYPLLYEQLFTIRKDAITETLVNEETGELLSSANYVRSLIYHDNNRIIPLHHRSNINIPSSHYTISYMVNLQKDTVELNFSIPKYLYGTNIFQFVNYYDQGCDTTYNELIIFLKNFFNDNFIQVPQKEDVEIRRIDFCYNQFFNSRSDALQYLDYQKEIVTKYARSSTNNFRSYETSLMYVTDRYSFKIYHKGTEFKKHDFKEIIKGKNPKGYDLDFLLNESERILRYEITYRNKYFNYILSNYFFDSEARSQRPEIQAHPITKVMRAFITFGGQDYYSYWKDKQKSFCLSSPFDDYNATRMAFDSLKEHYNITFDKVIFSILYENFWHKVKQYQVQVKMSIGEVVERITEHNKTVAIKNQIRRSYTGGDTERDNALTNSRMVILAILSQHVNLQEIYKAGLIPKSTYYRMKTDLKKVGVAEYSANDGIPTPPLNYLDYKYIFGRYIN